MDVEKEISDLYEECEYHCRAGKFHEALQIAKIIPKKIKDALGEDNLEFAKSLVPLAFIYQQIGKYLQAEPLYLKILQIRRKSLDKNGLEVAESRNDLGSLYFNMGRYSEAESLFLDALNARINLLGSQNFVVTITLTNLASLYCDTERYEIAEDLYKQVMEFYFERFGLHDIASDFLNCNKLAQIILDKLVVYFDPLGGAADQEITEFSRSLSNLAELYRLMGEYEKAKKLFPVVADIQMNIVGKSDLSFANTLHNYALLGQDLGQYSVAETNYNEALKIRKSILGEDHPLCAYSMCSLAELFIDIGDETRAKSLIDKSFFILETSPSATNLEYVSCLETIAKFQKRMGHFSVAKELFEKALDIKSDLFGENSNGVAICLNNLGTVNRALNEFPEAEKCYQKASKISQNVLGKKHRGHLFVVNNLAFLFLCMGRYKEAESLFKKVLKYRCRAVGHYHPEVSESLVNLSVLYVATDRVNKAMKALRQASEIHDYLIQQVFSFAAPATRLNHLEYIRQFMYLYLNLVLQFLPDSESAIHSAMDLVLKRKSVEVDFSAALRDMHISNRYPDTSGQFEKIKSISSQMGKLLFSTSHREKDADATFQIIDELAAEKEKIEEELIRGTPDFYFERILGAANVETVASKITNEEILIEFVRVRSFKFLDGNHRGWEDSDEDQYLALTLPGGKLDSIHLVHLGNARSIDKLIALYRDQITGGNGDDNETNYGVALRNRVFDNLAI